MVVELCDPSTQLTLLRSGWVFFGAVGKRLYHTLRVSHEFGGVLAGADIALFPNLNTLRVGYNSVNERTKLRDRCEKCQFRQLECSKVVFRNLVDMAITKDESGWDHHRGEVVYLVPNSSGTHFPWHIDPVYAGHRDFDSASHVKIVFYPDEYEGRACGYSCRHPPAHFGIWSDNDETDTDAFPYDNDELKPPRKKKRPTRQNGFPVYWLMETVKEVIGVTSRVTIVGLESIRYNVPSDGFYFYEPGAFASRPAGRRLEEEMAREAALLRRQILHDFNETHGPEGRVDFVTLGEYIKDDESRAFEVTDLRPKAAAAAAAAAAELK
ncbi:uncharacterized protein LOC62_01G001583 [Vanrija pseudolonga]|uniref:Uncharacterized protein n=1 Tax=Vanrija pseudolonga TaxID=143232 RepID=A0AAF0Y5G2_9TREE|nr:hypothetical protein LOC62_01G001583 [Vanrija pseudolonga]